MEKSKNIILLIVLFAICTLFYIDSDLYYMLTTGRYIYFNGIPYENVFSIFGGKIVLQNWLYCLLLFFFKYNIGDIGLILFLYTQYIIYVYLLYKVTGSRVKAIIIFLSTFYFNIRPEILTNILLVAEIYILEKEKPKTWILPILFLLEINLHATYWPLHILILLLYYKKLTKKDILPICLSILALFINPYGIDNVLYIIKSVFIIGDTIPIVELQPIYTSPGILIIVALTILTIVIFFRKQLTKKGIFIGLFLILLVCYRVKFLPIYAICLIYVLKPIQYQIKIDNFVKVFSRSICLLVSIFIIIFSLTQYSVDNISNLKILSSVKNKSEKLVIGLFDVNNYLEYLGYKVITDARPELYTKEMNGKFDYSLINRYQYLTGDDVDIILSELKPDYYIASIDSVYQKMMKSKYYELEEVNGKYYIFKRKILIEYAKNDLHYYESVIL